MEKLFIMGEFDSAGDQTGTEHIPPPVVHSKSDLIEQGYTVTELEFFSMGHAQIKRVAEAHNVGIGDVHLFRTYSRGGSEIWTGCINPGTTSKYSEKPILNF